MISMQRNVPVVDPDLFYLKSAFCCLTPLNVCNNWDSAKPKPGVWDSWRFHMWVAGTRVLELPPAASQGACKQKAELLRGDRIQIQALPYGMQARQAASQQLSQVPTHLPPHLKTVAVTFQTISDQHLFCDHKMCQVVSQAAWSRNPCFTTYCIPYEFPFESQLLCFQFSSLLMHLSLSNLPYSGIIHTCSLLT